MKFFFLLLFLMAAKDAWTELIIHTGDWNPEVAVAWCSVAAYTTLSSLGIFYSLKMLPIMMSMLLYKRWWLFFVVYPLWGTNQLEGTATGEWAKIFIIIAIPILFMLWKYVLNTFILGRD